MEDEEEFRDATDDDLAVELEEVERMARYLASKARNIMRDADQYHWYAESIRAEIVKRTEAKERTA